MSYRNKKQKSDLTGVTAEEMNGLAALLLEAFQGSIRQQLEETGEVNPRLLSEAVKWLQNSGVTLSASSPAVVDFSAIAASLSKAYEDSEIEHNYL